MTSNFTFHFTVWCHETSLESPFYLLLVARALNFHCFRFFCFVFIFICTFSLYFIIFFTYLSIIFISHVTVNILWFQEVNYLQAFWIQSLTKLSVFLVTFITSVIFIWGNSHFADKEITHQKKLIEIRKKLLKERLFSLNLLSSNWDLCWQ